MKIIFIGCVEFSYKILECLISEGANIVGVCTKERSKFNSDFTDLTPLCREHDIPYYLINNINSSENIAWMHSLNADVIFCFGWSSLLKKDLLNLAPMGVIGYHPAKLPQNRGRHPLIWSLVLGLQKSASTFFFMDEGADSGDILSQVDFDICHEDDAKSLYNKVIELALSQVKTFLPALQNKSFIKTPQLNENINYWRKRSIVDGEINFRMNSLAIYRLVNALCRPYVGAHVTYKEELVKIWKVEETVLEYQNIEPGKVVLVEGIHVFIKAYDRVIKLVEHEFNNLPKVGEYL